MWADWGWQAGWKLVTKRENTAPPPPPHTHTYDSVRVWFVLLCLVKCQQVKAEQLWNVHCDGWCVTWGLILQRWTPTAGAHRKHLLRLRPIDPWLTRQFVSVSFPCATVSFVPHVVGTDCRAHNQEAGVQDWGTSIVVAFSDASDVFFCYACTYLFRVQLWFFLCVWCDLCAEKLNQTILK